MAAPPSLNKAHHLEFLAPFASRHSCGTMKRIHPRSTLKRILKGKKRMNVSKSADLAVSLALVITEWHLMSAASRPVARRSTPFAEMFLWPNKVLFIMLQGDCPTINNISLINGQFSCHVFRLTFFMTSSSNLGLQSYQNSNSAHSICFDANCVPTLSTQMYLSLILAMERLSKAALATSKETNENIITERHIKLIFKVSLLIHSAIIISLYLVHVHVE